MGRNTNGTDVRESHECRDPAMSVFADIVQQQRPDLPDADFRIARAGWPRLGIGQRSQEDPDQGRRAVAQPEDDVLLEAKAVRTLAHLRCLKAPRVRATFRVITGNQQLGRLKHDILVAGPEVPIPELTAEGRILSDWWIAAGNPLIARSAWTASSRSRSSPRSSTIRRATGRRKRSLPGKQWMPPCSSSRWRRSVPSRGAFGGGGQPRGADAASLGSDPVTQGFRARKILEHPGSPAP